MKNFIKVIAFFVLSIFAGMSFVACGGGGGGGGGGDDNPFPESLYSGKFKLLYSDGSYETFSFTGTSSATCVYTDTSGKTISGNAAYTWNRATRRLTLTYPQVHIDNTSGGSLSLTGAIQKLSGTLTATNVTTTTITTTYNATGSWYSNVRTYPNCVLTLPTTSSTTTTTTEEDWAPSSGMLRNVTLRNTAGDYFHIWSGGNYARYKTGSSAYAFDGKCKYTKTGTNKGTIQFTDMYCDLGLTYNFTGGTITFLSKTKCQITGGTARMTGGTSSQSVSWGGTYMLEWD